MRHLPGRILTAFAVMTMFASFPACTRTDQKPAGPAENITIAFATPPYTVLADIALARGYFRQEGLNVTPHFHSTGKASLDEVLADKADFATVAETPAMFAIMQGKKIAIVATIQTSNMTSAILARKDRGILKPRDLKGMRIGTPLGTIGEFFLDAFLAANGISRKEITVLDLKPEEIAGALTKGDVEAAATWPPFISQAQKALGEKGIVFHDEDIYTQTFNIVAKQEYVRTHPARVEKLLRAVIRAEEFARLTPVEARETIADFRRMDKALLSDMWTGSSFSVTLDQALVLALEDESRWAIAGGLTKETKVPNYLDFIYVEGLASVKPKAVRILR